MDVTGVRASTYWCSVNVMHHCRGKEELPWRKARTERRRSRERQRRADADTLAAPADSPTGSALSMAEGSYDSWSPDSTQVTFDSQSQHFDAMRGQDRAQIHHSSCNPLKEAGHETS